MRVWVNSVVTIYIIQRLLELYLSKKNETFILDNFLGERLTHSDALRMRIFHTCWFISLLIEANIKNELLGMKWRIVVISILFLAQAIRIYTMKKLGVFWTVTIMNLKSCRLYDKGLYKIVRHPNYLAVILELIFIPLFLKSFFTLIVFSFLNLFILKKRIKLEETQLMKCCSYSETFKNTKMIIPFLY